MQNSFGIASFRSRQQVLRTEDILRREGIPTQIITTPRAVSMGCGLSLRFELAHADHVRDQMRRVQPPHLIGLYRVDANGTNVRVSPLQNK